MAKKKTRKAQGDFESMLSGGVVRKRLFDYLSSGAKLLAQEAPFLDCFR